MATIRDIAARAGVSTATVSRAFATPERVRPSTLDTIREAAAGLGYAPDPTARSLARGRTQILGLLVPDLANPVHASMVKSARTRALAAGYTLLVADRDADASSDVVTVRALSARTDGMALLLPRLSDDEVRDAARRGPLITLNRVVEGVPAVTIDSREAITAAVEHLAQQGHRRVLNILGPEGTIPGEQRRHAVAEQCARAGLELVEIGPFPPQLPTDDTLSHAVVEARRRDGVTAVIAYNDLLAIGLYRGLAREGLRVGRDLALVGHDDIWVADYLLPTLTSVRLPGEEATKRAVSLLLDVIASRNNPTTDHPASQRVDTLACRLVIRDSTALPRP